MVHPEYEQQLDDEIFRHGEMKGRITTSITVLTDALLALNALEVYYQKPASKSITPPEIEDLRTKLTLTKELLREVITSGAR
jgi:hypothetical protein